jgi:hypothetical protein
MIAEMSKTYRGVLSNRCRFQPGCIAGATEKWPVAQFREQGPRVDGHSLRIVELHPVLNLLRGRVSVFQTRGEGRIKTLLATSGINKKKVCGGQRQ